MSIAIKNGSSKVEINKEGIVITGSKIIINEK